MPFNNDIWEARAVKGDVAGPVIKASLAIMSIADALEKIQNQQDISQNIRDIRDRSFELNKIFDDLTGWKPE